MEKKQLTEAIKRWLTEFLDDKYGQKFTSIDVLVPDRDLKRLNNQKIRAINGSHAWEFTPDIIAVLSKGSETELIFVNRSVNAISLKEIGEMYCYAQLAKPLLAIVISPKAASNEVNGILIDKNMQQRILNYNGSNPILILGFDELIKQIDLDSVIPLEQKEFFS